MIRHIGLLDGCALAMLGVILAMPPQEKRIVGAYDFQDTEEHPRNVPEEIAKLGELQARVQANPENGQAAYAFAQHMRDLGRHDMAIRIAGTSASKPSPSNWRAQSIVSSAYTDRATKPIVVNNDAIRESFHWAEQAKESCVQAGPIECPPDEALRLQLAFEDLRHGVEILKSASFSPSAFRQELQKTRPMIRIDTPQ